ncbi:MAG: hypothetical protein WCH98_23180 [Verrucomicrobiota bacterium]
MGSPDSESPIPPAAKPKQAGKKSAPSSSGKHLSIIRSSAEREDVGKDEQRYGETEAPAGGNRNRFFREVASRHSSQVSTGVHSPQGNRRSRRARRRGRLLLLRFHLKVALRRFRRFHNRFTFQQILGFYIGVPACLSLALCLVFLFGKPPAAVTPSLVSQRKPSAVELVQQIQSALGKHDSRSAHSAVAGLEELYPKDPRTYVARGTVFANEKNYAEARKSYLHALELVRDLPPALINLGEVEFASANYSQAAEYYERAGLRLPRNSLILFRRYLCYSLLKDRTKTDGVIKELAARPDTVEWYFIQASEAIRAGKNPEAQRLVATAKTLFGEQASAYQESLKKIGWLK